MLKLLVLIWLLVKFLCIFELLFYAVNPDKLIARNVNETTVFQTNTILLYDYINYERESKMPENMKGERLQINPVFGNRVWFKKKTAY